ALTAGAIGTMILAVMPRVTLGHTGRLSHRQPGNGRCFCLDQCCRDKPGCCILERGPCDDPPCPLGWVLDGGVRTLPDRVRPDAVDAAIHVPRLTVSE